MRRAALAAADARVLRRLRWRRSTLLENGLLVRFAALRAARSVLPATAAAAAERALPVRAQRAQALGAARCVSGESAPVDDSSQASSGGSSSEGEPAHVERRRCAPHLSRTDAALGPRRQRDTRTQCARLRA